MNNTNILKYTTAFLYIYSIYPWFTWEFNKAILIGIIFLLFAVCKSSLYSENTRMMDLTVISLVLFTFWVQGRNINGVIFSIMTIYITLVLYKLKDSCKIDVINCITKLMSLIVIVSLAAFILFKMGVSLPHTDIVTPEGKICINYYFFILGITERYQSIFLEPGYFTLGIAPLLFLNKYNIKNKYVLILLAGQFFSFSLAGYIILLFGFLWHTIMNNETIKSKVIHILGAIFVLVSMLYIFNIVFKGDILNEMILERIQIENGNLNGNNRTTEYFDGIYSVFLNSPQFLTGVGKWDEAINDYGSGNAGYKVFLYLYGLIGAVLCLLFYCSLLLRHRTKDILGLSVFILLLLFQNTYPLLWCFIISLLFGSAFLRKDENAGLYEKI